MDGSNRSSDEIRVELPDEPSSSSDDTTIPNDSEISNFVPDVEVNHIER